MKEGDQSMSVTWPVPRPTCGGQLRTTTPEARSGQNFVPGVYKIEYLYQTTSRFDIVCTVQFQVKGLCSKFLCKIFYKI